MIAVLVAVCLLATWNVLHNFRSGRAAAQAQLQSISELRVNQVETWVSRQMTLASFLTTSTPLAELYLRWQVESEADPGERLLGRVVGLREANDADSALLVSSEGKLLASEHTEPPELPDALRHAIDSAVASGKPVHTGIYRVDGAQIPTRMDVVIPMLGTGPPTRGLMVLRVDAQRTIFRTLASWPVPSETGETLLWRRQGPEHLALVNRPNRPPEAGSDAPLAWATSAQAVAVLMRGEVEPGQGFTSTDYAGERVLANVRPIPGTDWWLVSKIDLDEVDKPAGDSVLWSLGAVLLAMSAVGAVSRWWLQRQNWAQGERERVQQRERLQALSLLEAVAQSSNDAIFAKDLQGRYVLFNRAAAEELGRARELVLGRTDHELYGPEVAARLLDNDEIALSGGVPRVFEEHIPAADGERVKLCTRGPLRDGDNHLIGVFGVSRDITEQRRTERAMRDSEAHYRTVVSVLHEGILVSDPEGHVLSCNPAAERIVGSLETDWQGRSVLAPGWKAYRPDGSEMPAEETPPGRVLAGHGPQTAVLLSTRSPSGEQIWFEVSAQPVISPDSGDVMAVVTSFSDVTQRKRMVDELEAHRNRLQELVAGRTQALLASNRQLEDTARFNLTLTDTLPGRVAYWDADLRCRFANRSYFDWYGKTPEEVLGRSVHEIYDEAYVNANLPRLQATLNGAAQHFERETRRADGSFHVHQVHYIPDQQPGEPARGLYVMAFDITALKQAQADLGRMNAELAYSRDAAEAANRAKSAFLANMSHEIRTPMNAIIGLTHLMSRDTRDTQQRERLAKVDHAAQHLLQVINDILDLSKIEAGKMALDDAEFSLDVLLSRSFEMVSERAREKGLELILDPDQLPERMRGDSTRLSQALINLLVNAVKFTDHGWVRLRGELLREEGQRLQVRFEVRDTGVGIALDRQAELFTAFEQADNSSTRRHGGTGLGLALTRHIAQLMGGEAGVISTPGEGSIFWFTAWLGRAHEAGEHAAPIPMQGLRALLVDDLPEALAALSARLNMFGIQVDALADGETAVRRVLDKLAAGEPYDLLLADWRMAPLDGIQTLQKLRDILGAGMPPHVLVTAFDDIVMWQQARAINVDAVLIKPITASALHDTLVRVLRKQGTALVAPPPPGEAEALLKRRHAGQRVLLAEDNPINQEVAGELLRSVGLVVETAEDGARALELGSSRHYDMVLMDVQMPGMDGLQATRALRERLGRGLPIIAMTAHAFGEDRAACLGAGMNDHVAKPVDPEVLYATLLRWLPLRDRPDPIRLPLDDGTEPAAPPVAPLQQRLAEVPGFDLQQGLRSVGGQMPALARVLGLFTNTYAKGDAALAAPAEAASVAGWRHASHSLRGACGTVGAAPLLQHLQAFDKALAAGVDVAALAAQARQLNAELMALVARLKAELSR